MIERFNFYDVYGYLIPGFAWLLLLALPFHLQFHFVALSASEFTASLVLGYLAGHVLSGLARKFIDTQRFEIPVRNDQGETQQKPVPRSVAVLWSGHNFRDRLTPEVRKALKDKFAARFGYDPITPFDISELKQMFFLCRTALSQAKLNSYVEQFQGMNSLTRSLSLAFFSAACFYTAWIVASAWVTSNLQSWPMAILVAGAAIAFLLNKELAAESRKEKRALVTFRLNVEQAVAIVGLMLVGIAVCYRQPLTWLESMGLATSVSASWLIALRLRNASDAFDESLVSAVYRDFVALESGRESQKLKPYCKPDDD